MVESSPPHPIALAQMLKREGRSLGFAAVGIADAGATEHGAFYRRWLAAGRHGDMAYLSRPDAVRRREDLRETHSGVRSVVVVADPYPSDDAAGVPDDPSVGVIARYARGADYHRVLARKLEGLRRALRDGLGLPYLPGRAYVDTGPLLERDLGRRAGLGWFGRNTMLIDPRHGSYFLLGVLLLELEVAVDEPFEMDRCGTCEACLGACPTGALLGRDPDGGPVIDATRCISYLTIELDGQIPAELRPALGNRVFGCDICQEACPWNARMPERAVPEPRYAARAPGAPPPGVEPLPDEQGAGLHPGTTAPSLIGLMETALDEARWDRFSRGSALRRTGRTGFARNVAVGLGNWGDPAAVPVLVRALGHEAAVVRSHAAWALGRVGGLDARSSLTARLEGEPDDEVIEEIRAALEGRGR